MMNSTFSRDLNSYEKRCSQFSALSAAAVSVMLSLLILVPPAAGSEDDDQSVFAATGVAAAQVTDGLARSYVELLIGVDKYFDSAEITKPEHRFYLQERMMYDGIDTGLARFDAYSGDFQKRWATADPTYRIVLRGILANERDRLESFLRENPDIIRAIIRPLSESGKLGTVPTGDIMRRAREAGEAADTGDGFVDRLRRAARVGDAELRRVVTLKIRAPAVEFTDRIADNYAQFLVAAGQELDSGGITDTIARAFTLAGAKSLVADTMIAEYDQFASVTAGAFKGAGKVIEKAAAAALAAERNRIAAFLAVDPAEIIEGSRDEDGKSIAGSALLRQMEAEAEMKVMEEGGE